MENISIPTGRCCVGSLCQFPHLELRKEHTCPSCKKILHPFCGEFDVKLDKYLCKLCIVTEPCSTTTTAPCLHTTSAPLDPVVATKKTYCICHSKHCCLRTNLHARAERKNKKPLSCLWKN